MGDWVLHIALCTSIFGLGLLTLASEFLEPPYSKIESINTGFIGKSVHLAGEVSGIHKFKGGSLLIKLSDGNNSVDIFLPYPVPSQINFEPALNQSIDLIGVVEVYDGRLEVAVEKQSNVRLIEDED